MAEIAAVWSAQRDGSAYPRTETGSLTSQALWHAAGNVAKARAIYLPMTDGLKVVVDSSELESDFLSAFLAHDVRNQAVLTEFAWVESFKQEDPLASITRCLAVLAQFPDQVIVLKSNNEIAALDPRSPGLAARMARRRGSQEFADTVTAIRQAREGDMVARTRVLENGKRAATHIAEATAGVSEMIAAWPEMESQMFSRAEVRKWRSERRLTPGMIISILGAAEQIADTLYRAHPAKPRWPSTRSLKDSFLYRYSFATVLYLLNWIETGSQPQKRCDRVRNDYIDLTFATLGTYFNGLMSSDKRALSMYLELSHVLATFGARVPPCYIEPWRAAMIQTHAEDDS